jgi:U3 small nucleolar RNA-associated protein 3
MRTHDRRERRHSLSLTLSQKSGARAILSLGAFYNPTRESIAMTTARLVGFRYFVSNCLVVFLLKSIGATKLGQQYLLTKALLQSSAALNLAMYLLLKAEQAEADDTVDPGLIQSHPVMLHLQKLNSLTQNLEDGVENKATGLREQLDNLVKAAALLGSSDAASNSDNDSDDNADESSESVDIPAQTVEESKKRPTSVSKNDESASSESEPADSSEDEATASRTVLTEARFGLRPSEVANEKSKRKRRRPMIYDAGDDAVEATQQKNISHSLATTLNAIEQRSETRKKRSAPLAEHLDEHEDDDGELRRGLEMMEAELGKASDEDELGDGHDDPELDDDEVGDDFYSQVSRKSKSRKEFKKNLYRVAPKFPRIEGEIDGERAISQQILKNRGLVAHKAKINRNPRVKKREQYRKAIIRRKGAVRDVRTDEGHKYGGEETGIKTNLSKSRKLAR